MLTIPADPTWKRYVCQPLTRSKLRIATQWSNPPTEPINQPDLTTVLVPQQRDTSHRKRHRAPIYPQPPESSTKLNFINKQFIICSNQASSNGDGAHHTSPDLNHHISNASSQPQRLFTKPTFVALLWFASGRSN